MKDALNHTMIEKNEVLLLPREGVIITLLGITVVLVTMNTAMFNLALNDLSHFFNLPSSIISLTVTGYSIMFAISSITYSRLSDSVPLNRLFAISLVLTGAASVIAMLSNQFWLLLVARVVQAAGAGAALSLSIVLLTRYVPQARRGKSMTFIMSSVSLGFGLGPVIGGLVVQYLGWRYLFAITSLLLCIAPLLVRYIPQESLPKRPFDLLGAISLSAGTAGLLLFLTNNHPIALLIGILGLLVFVMRIRRAKHPFVLPLLLANKTYLVLAFIGVLSYLCNFATLFLLPQMLLKHFGLSAGHSGFVIFPGAILSMLLSRMVGAMIDKRGNSSMLRAAPMLILMAAVLFAGVGTQYWVANIFVYMLMNLGFAIINSSVLNEISCILPSSQIGSGAGLFQLMQIISGAFGIAVLSSALEWQHSHAYANLFWAVAAVAVLANLCAFLYVRGLAQNTV
ncbi:MFS transporter [Paenibacillus brasilensis]|uniref:DHA2 family metal-tetracycline-proton antiporter-like MFS transporter n=1 Tax=Paenibacillus brasilensis TaxID=128574 RepID=A0ABU0L0U4_9BACL|nr:MFS transporter [Paenibacillus brasilensis]MDQ0495305.1 DHA2 family metal-tetracycline-proton antiporter-like MFS transporter [Paenibacillus brasilensis]